MGCWKRNLNAICHSTKKMKNYFDKNVILLMFLLSDFVQVKEIKNDHEGKVIDGIEAKMGQFPFMASIMRKAEFGQRCGGCVLNRWFVFTACHCITEITPWEKKFYELSWLLVVAGHVNRLPGRGGQVRFIDAAIIHEKCERVFPGATYDVALIKVNLPFRWTPYLKPTPLFSTNPKVLNDRINDLMAINAECFGIGWGMTKVMDINVYEYPSVTLLYAKLRMMELSGCASLMPEELNERRQICALGYEYSDVCKADSGGPLYCLGHVYAVVSWGPYCGELNLSTMYQRLDTDMRFISSSPQTFPSFIIFLLIKSHMTFI